MQLDHTFPGGANLVSRNEMLEVNAKRSFYENVKATKEKRLVICKRVSKFYVPVTMVSFMFIWWIIGMTNYLKPNL